MTALPGWRLINGMMRKHNTILFLLRLAPLALLFSLSAFPQGKVESELRAEGRVVADFESDADLDLWKGLAVQPTRIHVSSGRQAMTFRIPAVDERKGEDPRPRVQLSFQDGRGFPGRDWSGYGALGLDFWIDGAPQGRLGIKLLDRRGVSSWTTHVEAAPGMKYEAWLSMEDVAGDIDPKNIDAVVIYSLRPTMPFEVTVDHLRLAPRALRPPAEMVLTYPNYRGWIFPGAGPLELSVKENAAEYGYRPGEWEWILRLEQDPILEQKTGRMAPGGQSIRLAADRVKAGPVRFTAEVLRRGSRALLARRTWELKKLSDAEVAALNVYVDRGNNTIVDGKPFFPIGFYANTSREQMREVRDSPFNTLLMYGTNRKPRREMEAILDEMNSAGMKLIYCLNDVYPWATYLKEAGWEGIRGNESIAAAVVEAYRNHPALLAWYLNDELPREKKAELTDYYRQVRLADPAHPTLITLCQNKDFPYLWDTTDILSPDPYPIPREPITRVSDMMRKARAPTLGSQPVWMVPQSFAWYQHSPGNSDRARIPRAEELATGRAPTREEARCMTYLGLVHGAKGLIYWCYYNMRVLPQYLEMWAWMKSIAAEVKQLAPVLMSLEESGPYPVPPEDSGIHALWKSRQRDCYLLAVNTEARAVRLSLALPDGLPPRAEVLFENRSLEIRSRRLEDEFPPLAVHVYRFRREEIR